LYIFNNII